MLTLPNELVVLIASQLSDHVSLARMAEVCSAWSALLSGPDGERLWADCARALWACKQRPAAEPGNGDARFGGGWKARYARALVDSQRRRLLPHELARAVWRFRFLEDLEVLNMTDEERRAREMDEPSRLCFHADGTYTSTIPGAPSSTRALSWRILEEGGVVKIGAYPRLHVERMADWGWRMSNQFVEFTTVSL